MDLREAIHPTGRRHPWETARLAFFRRQLRGRGLLGPGATVIDAGAGDAFFARQLVADVAPGGRIFAFDPQYSEAHLERLASDPSAAGIEFARTRPAVRADLLLLMDVLEHVADDRALLVDLVASVVRPGGHVLVSVPAWDQLYTRHDAILGHYRRYSPAYLRGLLADGGLALVAGGGLFHTLLPLRALRRLAAGRFRDADSCRRGQPAIEADTGLARWRAGARLTALVEAVLRVDGGLSAWSSRASLWLPGLSLWALAVRRAE